MVFDSYVFSAAGGREVNEDAVLCRELPDGLLCVVADGLGGHRSGELASAKVTGLFADVPPPETETDAAAWLRESVEAAGTAVLELQRETGGQMKSTVAALLLRDNGEAAWANVG
ncbi:MAG: protein phosphatase 2C domain-containing protein, partial [Oscillospiraceae bacterium]|nr:protein phosphatase 2C domain-containing protein [Oscillospiraceae bacterium]